MARWSLRNTHYLNVPGNEWLHEETDRETGRRNRKMYIVPQLLDPANPQDQNYPGEVIVCHEGKGERKDIVFEGEPTPDMEALDDEAKAISASLEDKWTHPIDTIPTNGGMNEHESAFMKSMMESFSKAVAPQNASVPQADFDALKKQVEELMAQNKELQAAKTDTPAARRA